MRKDLVLCAPQMHAKNSMGISPNQECRPIFIFDMGGGADLVEHQRHLRACAHRGGLRGDVPPSEAGKFCIFATGIVQFGEYF